ncbi:hypothetical protein M885DRAFT_510004 [Pelagophyceae sp. CCMP2097]|nr:hypothetical protein M885DRAFT_510004 [Pelagophyceae sp. CCMP2097]
MNVSIDGKRYHVQSQYASDCIQEAKASYKCQEENPANKKVCQKFFDAMRECKTNEHNKVVNSRGGSRKVDTY